MESGIFIFSHFNLFVEDLFPQPHKVAVITGGNRGIGLAVLKKLLECQMTVMMGVRNPEECMKIVEKSFDESLVKGKVFCARCDTSEMNSVKAFAQQVKEKFPAVHILINNGKLTFTRSIIGHSHLFLSWHSVRAVHHNEGRFHLSNGR